MDSCKKWHFTLKEEKRLRLKRKEWRIQQQHYREHEKHKSRMIKDFERRREAELIKNSDKESLQQRNSSNPQRREISFPDHKHSKERKTVNSPEGTIKQEDLHKIKISIHGNNLSTNHSSNNIEWGIDPNDVILPRRQNEGTCPIFKGTEIKKFEEIRKITFLQDKQLEKELSTSKKNASTSRSPVNNIIHQDCDSSSFKSSMCRNDRINNDDNKRYNHDRIRRQSSIRKSEEKDKCRNERRNRSSLRYDSDSAPFSRDRSKSRYRSRLPNNERGRERRDNNESKFSSRRNSDQSRDLDNHASSKSHFSSDNLYNPYIRLPGPMMIPIPRIQAPPMLMPVFPVLPPPFPPTNMYHWQQPFRFVNGSQIGIHNNRYNVQKRF
ncbi:PREDICTED: myb-like protein X [Cyphomyrmex costatus]|uniref:myb-like protein X n=1 Tax=Cyphomyrmex costatus TaxID=456900 RepID=UPI00085224A7|nr:PREDICTED: myb-like protein X [Cyphomyrmex costatus]XP_018394765.1 PREDICTED: myb-like protein X [Cyphomyrmex costatus]XP_018394766.1 PREDICTED: myb-like protein X [Cyphomyrmex costatus]